MIVFSNIPALNTHLRLKNANFAKENNIEKLSSGLRIAKAADDAAGLSISEKMRAQIRGLNQARRNVQDGISFIQVAEIAMGEITDILQEIREKIIQASNGTLTPSDIQHIFAEIDANINEIDNIANNTEFNNVKALRPPVMIEEAPTVTYGKTDIIFIIDKTVSMDEPIANVKANAESFVNMLSLNRVDVRLGLVAFGDIHDDPVPLIKSDMTSLFSEFEATLSTIYPGFGGGGDIPESGLEAIMDSEFGALTYDLRHDATKNFIFITDAPVHTAALPDNKSDYTIEEVADELVARDIKLTMVGPSEFSTKSQLEGLSGPTGGEYLNLREDFAKQLETLAGKISEEAGAPVDVDKDQMATLLLQIGANIGDNIAIELFDTRATKLGVGSISADNLEASIDIVDDAISIVSSHRSVLGAYQPRFRKGTT